MAEHLFDQVDAAFGRFEVRHPRNGIRLGCRVAPDQHVLVRFWDDGGADVLFRDAASRRRHRLAFAQFEVVEGTAKLFPSTPTR